MAPLRVMQMRMAAPIVAQRPAPERIDPARHRSPAAICAKAVYFDITPLRDNSRRIVSADPAIGF
jgi:hypothetical protein